VVGQKGGDAADPLIEALRLLGLDLSDVGSQLADGGTPAESWGRLQSVRGDIAESLRNSLAFLGSLYVQQNRLDDGYGAVVGGVLAELSRVLPKNISWPSVTLAVGDAFSPLTGTIWTRYPEFTVWALPMIVHEAGHVVTQELRSLTDDARGFDFPLSLLAAASSSIDTPQSLSDRLNREFIADFFGAWTMGAAYACSAILLRFTPRHADEIVAHHPPETERVHLILTTLECLDPGWDDVITLLRRIWDEMVDVFDIPPVSDGDRQQLDALVTSLAGLAERHFHDAAFRERSEVTHLTGKLEQPSTRPSEIARSSSLRQIINAAWIARLRNDVSPATVQRIEDVSMAACRAVIGLR
jgi:hypothetical protein